MSYPIFRDEQPAHRQVAKVEDDIQDLSIDTGFKGVVTMDSGAIGGIIVHRDGKPLHVSEAWAALHGYAAADVLSMPSIEPLRHPDDHARIATYVAEHAAGRYVPERYAYRARHKDGYFTWVDVTVGNIQWQGKPAILCMIIGIRDPSGKMIGRARANRQSDHSMALRLLNVIDQLPDGYALYDADERLVIWNERYVVCAPKVRTLCQAGDSFEMLIRAHVEKGEIKDAIGKEEAWIRRRLAAFRAKDGQSIDINYHQRIVQVRHLKTNEGGTLLITTDVTEARRAERRLSVYASAIDQLSERIIIVDCEQNVRLVNQSSLKFYNKELNQVAGKHLGDLIGWNFYQKENVEDLVRQALEIGAQSRHVYWRSNPDGERRYWETRIVPYRDPDSTIAGAIATSRDVTDHRHAEQARRRFQDAIEHIADGYALFDENERLIACNHYYYEKQAALTPGFALGISFEAIARGQVASGTIADAIGQEEEWVAERLRRFRANSHIGEFRETNGRWTLVRNRRTEDGGALLVVTDITESKLIDEALADSQSRFKDFTELAADWFWEQDAKGCYTYVSESIEKLTKQPVLDLLGKNPIEVFGVDVFKDPTWSGLWQELQTTGINRAIEAEHDLVAADGRIYRARSVVRPIKDEVGNVIGYRGAAKDVTEPHRLAKQLEYQANHDALTGLLNRRSFERLLDQAIKTSTNRRRPSVFCFIDLDQFKIVNDTAGHLAGDQLLRKVADLLSTKLHKGNILARLGGDEFGLLLHDCSLRRAQTMARNLIAALNEDRFIQDENVFEIGASIGLTQIASADCSVGELMAEADLACYAAKDHGRNRVHVYQHDDRELKHRRDEMSKASLIRRALDEERFALFAQPILPLAQSANGPQRYEILLRMTNQNGSMVVPGEFISSAERYGLMAEIDRWVLRQSFAQFPEILADQPNSRMNINLSGLSLNESSLVSFIMQLFQTYPIEPENVCFEVTETAAVRCLSKTKTLIRKLKKVGCRFALDDFGSGLSSFSYLKQLPVDYLKIDGSFIRDLRCDRRSRTMVEAIHQVAKSLDLETVAECVETKEMLETIRAIGIDFVQGHVVGRPQPLSNWSTPKMAAV